MFTKVFLNMEVQSQKSFIYETPPVKRLKFISVEFPKCA